jgi:hypothetical protein
MKKKLTTIIPTILLIFNSQYVQTTRIAKHAKLKLSQSTKNFNLYEGNAEKHLSEKLNNQLTYFWLSWDDYQAIQEIKKLIPKVLKKSFTNKRNYTHRTEKFFSEERTHEQALQEIISHIKNKVYSYAFDQTKNRDIANRTLNILEKELFNACATKKKLHNYFGLSLKKKVTNTIKIIQKKHAAQLAAQRAERVKIQEIAAKVAASQQKQAPKKFYPSDDCCICFTSLAAHNRLYLVPCGHDVCEKCYKKYKEKCAQCRAEVKGTYKQDSPPAYNPAYNR